jgi:hypothetical protein
MAYPPHKRLLLGSKLNNALRRAGRPGVDLTVMLIDEAYARQAVATCRTYGDEDVDLLLDQYVQLSTQEGAWKNGPSAPSYTTPLNEHDETVPASVQDYSIRPTSGAMARDAQPPTSQPPSSQPPSSVPPSSVPGEDGMRIPVKRGFLAGFASARSGGAAAPAPGTETTTPGAEQLKKYIRGAR